MMEWHVGFQDTRQSSLPISPFPDDQTGVHLSITVHRNVDLGHSGQESWVCVPVSGAYRQVPCCIAQSVCFD